MILPGITSISYIDSTVLTPNIGVAAFCGLPVAALAPMVRLPFVGEPKCEATDDCENNGRVEKVELSFQTEDNLEFLYHHAYAFHIETASGRCYLIGTREDTPVVSIITNTGVPDGTPAGYTVKVELQALKALVGVG